MYQHLLFVDAKSKHNSSSRRHSSPGENGLEESMLSNDYKSERKRNLTVKKKSDN